MPVGSIEGDEATTKSTFLYTMPLPIVSFAFDQGDDRAIRGFLWEKMFKDLKIKVVDYDPRVPPSAQWKGNDITIYHLPAPMQLGGGPLEGYRELWNYFMVLLGQAFRAPKTEVNSIGVDTMTRARRISADSRLQELQEKELSEGVPRDRIRKQLLQIEYGRPNDSIREIYEAASNISTSMGKNFVAIHHLTDEYVDVSTSKGTEKLPSGNKVLEGLNGTYRLVDFAMRFEKKRVGQQAEITAFFKKCGYNLNLENPDLAMKSPVWNDVMNMINRSLGGRLDLPLRG